MAEKSKLSEIETAPELADILVGHSTEMLGRARRIARSEADAEDAVLRAPHVRGAVERLGAWLLALVRRRCADIVREETRPDAAGTDAPGAGKD